MNGARYPFITSFDSVSLKFVSTAFNSPSAVCKLNIFTVFQHRLVSFNLFMSHDKMTKKMTRFGPEWINDARKYPVTLIFS